MPQSLWSWPLIVAILAMLIQQAFASMGGLVLPVVAPAMAAETGLPTALIGIYAAIVYGVSFVASLGCGGYIRRFGPLRVSQFAMLCLGTGLALSATGSLAAIGIGAMALGVGSAVSTPCSTEILARLSPPGRAPLVFSLKQTGVPVGGILAGLLVPALAAGFGWRGAFVGTATLCFVFAALLQPLRERYDTERGPGAGFSLGLIASMLRRVLGHPGYRELAFTLWVYVGVQALFGAFFVDYLVQGLGYPLAQAGAIFAGAQTVSIGARVLWGWISSALIAPRLMLALFGLMIALSAVATAAFTRDWSTLAITLVAMAYSASAISFHGVLIAEIARLAPKDEVGGMAGGVLSFAMLGMMSYPLIFGLVLQLSGGYTLGYALAALPALAMGVRLFRRVRRAG